MPNDYHLWKIFVTGNAKTAIRSTDYEYFYQATAAFTTSAEFRIPAAKFRDGEGLAVTSLKKATPGNGYYQLFINAQCQESAVYAVESSQLTIRATSPAQTILPGSPFTLSVVDCMPSTSVTLNT